MVEVDFVFLEGDTSLRRMVDCVQAALPVQGKEWYLYHVVVRERGVYWCIRLSQLSAELESRRWLLSTPLSNFHLTPCISVPLEEIHATMEQLVSYPFVVVEQDGRPAALYQGATPRGLVRTGPVGWWKLVGCRLSETGHIPEWPRPLPDMVECDKLIRVYPATTLEQLAGRLGQSAQVDGLALAIPVAASWGVCQAGPLLERIAAERPDAVPGSEVGAFVDLWPNGTVSVERLQTPWGLVKALLNSPEVRQLLITHQGQPVAVLRRHTAMRGGRHGKPPGWVKFLPRKPEPGHSAHGPAGLVNTWFADQDRQYVPHVLALAANRLYTLGVSIGARSDRANVVGPQPALDTRLIDHVLENGASLVFRLDSEDLIALDTEQEIALSAEGMSRECYFRIVTPVHTGLCSLRLSAFYENNLVQSHLVYALVAPSEGERPEGAGAGWWSECEYALSADLTNLRDLASRRVCIWIGEGKQEMQRAGIREATGMDIGPALTMNVRLIEEALKRYRELLIQSCVRETPGELEYLYRPDHTPRNLATFEQSIRELAELGQMLYERVFGQEKGHAIAQRLHEIERAQVGPLVVQIARLNLDTVFPWAVLYDRPLYYHPGRNVVCQRFQNEERCRTGCPHAEDPHVICPYGFWGFRYIVEQPLRPPKSLASVATRLEVDGLPRVAMVYGTGLEMARYHQQRLESIIGSRAQCVVHKTTARLLRELEDGPAVVYLYCHGESTRYRQWLVVGEGDPLMASHLSDHLREAWAGRGERRAGAPLVILNGCHTGYYDPSTLLSFVHRLGALGAAGVVGTEIPIHEYLANAFGEFFLTRLLSGDPVGRIIHDFRLELLGKRNVLGLAYVPYCYADLHIERRDG